MTNPHLQKLYYRAMQPENEDGTLGEAPTDLWLNIFMLYFNSEYRNEHAIGFTVDKFDLWAVKLVNMRTSQPRVVLAAWDGNDPESLGEYDESPSSDAWESIKLRVMEYLHHLRREWNSHFRFNTLGEAEKTLYAVIAMGRFVRFFALEPGAEELMDCSGTNDQAFEAMDDQSAIDDILTELASEVQGR